MKTIFTENRVLGEDTPKQALMAGRIIGSRFKRVAVGREGTKRQSELALISGLISAGADVTSLGECIETEVFFASEVCCCDLCLYIKHDPLIKIDVRERGGIVLSGTKRQDLEKAFKNGISENDLNGGEGDLTESSSLRMVYRNRLLQVFPKRSAYSVRVGCPGNLRKDLFAFKGGSQELTVSVSSDGTKASAFSKESGFVSMEELMMICCLDHFEHGEDAALPFKFPYAADGFAQRHGRRILRYYNTPKDDSDLEARGLALKQKFTIDGLYLAASALKTLAGKNMDIPQIREYIPRFYRSKRFIEMPEGRTKQIFQKFSSRNTPDGAAFAKNNSRVILEHSAAGKGIWLTADSLSMETASELCAGIEERLKNDTF